MQDFVSSRTACVAAVAAISITWGVFVGPMGGAPGGPWSLGLIGLLALPLAWWLAGRSAGSMAQVIREVDAEPRLATVPVGIGGPAGASMKGSRTR